LGHSYIIRKIKLYKTGDILKTNCHNIPMCFHLAICVSEDDNIYVWHCTPSKTNQFGGNIICEELSEFTKDREVREVYHYADANKDEIVTYANKNKDIKWDAIEYNCETFINHITNSKQKPTQLTKAIVLTTFVVGGLLILK